MPYKSGKLIVKPLKAENHMTYLFYARVFLLDGFNTMFGPFKLTIGCSGEVITVKDSPKFMTSGTGEVG